MWFCLFEHMEHYQRCCHQAPRQPLMTDAPLAVVKLQWRLRGERTEEQMTLPWGSDSIHLSVSPSASLGSLALQIELSLSCFLLHLDYLETKATKFSKGQRELFWIWSTSTVLTPVCYPDIRDCVCCSVSVWSFRLMCYPCSPAGIDSPEDVCILYSNRAACYLKDGNSSDCIQDCTKYVANFSSVHVCSFSQI